MLSTGVAGAHKIQGIGAGFVPDVLDTKVYDEIIPVDNEDAFADRQACRHAARACWSAFPPALPSGAAIELAKRPENAGKTIVVLLPGHRRPLSVHPAVRGLTVRQNARGARPALSFPDKICQTDLKLLSGGV